MYRKKKKKYFSFFTDSHFWCRRYRLIYNSTYNGDNSSWFIQLDSFCLEGSKKVSDQSQLTLLIPVVPSPSVMEVPKLDHTGNKLKANCILTKIIQKKNKLGTRLIKNTEHSNRIITIGSGYQVGTNYYTENLGNSQSSRMMIPSTH